MNLEVTSLTRKDQKIAETAASVFVITREDIRRSGATSIPEILRMVPGLLVARIDSNTWAVSSRSFNSRFTNKLLVLIDGRNVYSNLLPSVFWETLDTLLADIERIEVVRGPAATLWGANAVNGVVNIVTEEARDTEGTLLTSAVGTEERAFVGLRHGRRIGENFFWRAYGKYFRRDDSQSWQEKPADDGWEMVRGGFRTDGRLSAADRLTVQGDIYSGREGISGLAFGPDSSLPRIFEEDARVAGANILSRWEHRSSDAAGTELQLYYDWTRRQETILDEQRHTLDLDFQHHFPWGDRQRILWGGGYRYSLSDFDNSFTFAFPSERRTEHLYNLFMQDEVELVRQRLRLTVGARLENNSYTDFERHWNTRLLWTPADNLSLWGAVSRARRTPGRFDRESRILAADTTGSTPVLGVISGTPGFDAEKVTAFETGCRWYPEAEVNLDLVVFYQDYDKVRSFDFGEPFISDTPSPTHIVQPVRIDNHLEGETYGVEVASDWQPRSFLTLKTAYTFSRSHFRSVLADDDAAAEIEEGKNPRHQISLRSAVDLPRNLEFDFWLRYVEHLRHGDIPSYLELDARIAWCPRADLELSLVGQNLLDSHHPEFPRESLFSVFPTQVERGIYGKLLWHF